MNGIALCGRIRKMSDIPIIFLTALGAEADRVRGLRSGAGAYIVKPFPKGELLVREAAARRSTVSPSEVASPSWPRSSSRTPEVSRGMSRRRQGRCPGLRRQRRFRSTRWIVSRPVRGGLPATLAVERTTSGKADRSRRANLGSRPITCSVRYSIGAFCPSIEARRAASAPSGSTSRAGTGIGAVLGILQHGAAVPKQRGAALREASVTLLQSSFQHDYHGTMVDTPNAVCEAATAACTQRGLAPVGEVQVCSAPGTTSSRGRWSSEARFAAAASPTSRTAGLRRVSEAIDATDSPGMPHGTT